MAKKLSILFLVFFKSFLYSQSILTSPSEFYLPGTGQEIRVLDFEEASLTTEIFDYSKGWAGEGFGLTGSQRGAPEHVRVVGNTEIVPGVGNQVLEFYSYFRGTNPTSNFYLTNPSAINSPRYSSFDTESQDDFFMNSSIWNPSDTPSVLMHVYVPNTPLFFYTSIRMPSLIVYGTDPNKNTYPAIWLYRNELKIRCPGYGSGEDYSIDITSENFPEYDFSNNPVVGKWWTLGLSVTTEGVVQYYTKDSFVTGFSIEDLVADSKTVNDHLVRQHYDVHSKHDNVIMSSQINISTSPTLIDKLLYTHGTTKISSGTLLSKNEFDLDIVKIYPNPIEDILFLDIGTDIPTKVNYKISNLTGAIIISGKTNVFKTINIDVSDLETGVYLLSIDYNNNTVSKLVTKK